MPMEVVWATPELKKPPVRVGEHDWVDPHLWSAEAASLRWTCASCGAVGYTTCASWWLAEYEGEYPPTPRQRSRCSRWD